jgi:hypothetical protein
MSAVWLNQFRQIRPNSERNLDHVMHVQLLNYSTRLIDRIDTGSAGTSECPIFEQVFT